MFSRIYTKAILDDKRTENDFKLETFNKLLDVFCNPYSWARHSFVLKEIKFEYGNGIIKLLNPKNKEYGNTYLFEYYINFDIAYTCIKEYFSTPDAIIRLVDGIYIVIVFNILREM